MRITNYMNFQYTDLGFVSAGYMFAGKLALENMANNDNYNG